MNIYKRVAYVGVIGSGKNHRADKRKELGYTQIDFADPLREYAWMILGWRPNTPEEYDIFKNITLTTGTWCLLDIKVTGREFLQRVGNEAREVIDSNVWVDAWTKKVNECQGNVVCSDLRYPNELEIAHRLGFKIVFCDYKSGRYTPDDPHISESLAQRMLADGREDGEVLQGWYINKILRGE